MTRDEAITPLDDLRERIARAIAGYSGLDGLGSELLEEEVAQLADAVLAVIAPEMARLREEAEAWEQVGWMDWTRMNPYHEAGCICSLKNEHKTFEPVYIRRSGTTPSSPAEADDD